MLDLALHSLEAGRGADALDALLDAWRSSRDPRLGSAIARLGERQTDDPTEALASLKGDALHQAWIDLACQAPAEVLTPLLARMSAYIEDTRFTWPVVQHLATRDPDPRIATMAVALLRRFDQMKSASQVMARHLADCVERHGDISNRSALKRVVVPWQVAGRIENVGDRLPQPSSPPPFSEEALQALDAAIGREGLSLTRAERPRKREGASPEELLAQIYADPTDDGARLVYADLLLERGDPRGEFIQLQFRARDGTLTRREGIRMRALQRKHQKEWLRSIWVAFDLQKGRTGTPAVHFERGFLASAHVLQPRRAPSDLWERPEWSTVQRLEGVVALGPTMTGLEEVSFDGVPQLISLPRLRRLEVFATRELLSSDWPELPALTELELYVGEDDLPEILALLVKQPFAARLRELVLHPWRWPLTPALEATLEASPLQTVVFKLWDTEATLRRGTSGRFDRVTLRVQLDGRTNDWQAVLGTWRTRPVASLVIEIIAPGRGALKRVHALAEGCAAEIQVVAAPGEPDEP